MAEILLVDDDRDLVETMTDLLTCEGYSVRFARNGEAGLAELDAVYPDVIVCDVDMPVLDGPGMAKCVLAHDAGAEKIPFILVSGVPDLGRLARSLGTPYYLAKPYEVDQLLALLERALKERIPPTPTCSSDDKSSCS